MDHYVDIENCCAEDLEEEKELTEAVEALVGQAAVSVWSEIVSDISTALQDVRTWLEGTFPMLTVYQHDHETFWQHVQALGILLLLVTISFWSLAPWKRRRQQGSSAGTGARKNTRLQRSNSLGWAPLHKNNNNNNNNNHEGATMSWGRGSSKRRFLLPPNSSSVQSVLRINDSSAGDTPSSPNNTDEETDEERFAQNFPIMMQECRYAKLLLPPTCRRMEAQEQQQRNSSASASSMARISSATSAAKPTTNKNAASTVVQPIKTRRKSIRKKRHKMPARAAADDTSSSSVPQMASITDTEKSQHSSPEERDNPALRLQTYWRHFLHLLHYFMRLDYAQAGWTLILWTFGIWKQRRQSSSHHEQEQQSTTAAAPNATNDDDNNDNNNADEKAGEDDDLTDATSGIETTTDEEIVSSTQCLSPVVSAAEQENDVPHPPLGDQDDDDNDEASFHTPSTATQKQVIPPPSIRDAPYLPKDDLHPHRAITATSKPKDGISPTSPSERQSVAKRLSGLLRPRFKKQSSNRSPTDSSEELTKEVPNSAPTTLDILDSGKAPTTSKTETSTALTKKAAESPLRRSILHFFDPAHNGQSLREMSVQVPVPDQHGYILGDEFLPSKHQTPLLVFVNSRSGPQQGQLLISQLRRLLNPIQIWDLAHGGPEQVLESFCALTKLRILVCGGDGSVAWIISALEKLNLARKWPPIAILPLGTGNDLARVMGWGGGYNNESLIGILEQISESYTTLLDRWEMVIDDHGKKQHKNFFNYFGVGADAEAALQVHYLRESRPDWFFSRLVNKAWYGVFGAEDIIKNTSTALYKDIVLYADGVKVPLPSDSQGIIILNIDSYAGGIPIWANGWSSNPELSDRLSNDFASHIRPRRASSVDEFRGDDYPLRRSISMGDRLDSSDDLSGLLAEEERYESVTACNLDSSCQDGILEVVSIRSLFHLGQIRVGLSNAQRLCQCRHIKIVTHKKVAFQIDGEPWRQDRCELEIRRKKDPALMLHRSVEDGAEMEMSKLLEWAEERELIDGRVNRILMKEFSRRIESKTRRRRAPVGVLQHLTRRRVGGGTQGTAGALALAHHRQGGMAQVFSQPNLQTQGAPLLQYQGQHASPPQKWSNGISF